MNAVVESVESAEKKLGKPASSIEIFVELNQHHPLIPVKNIWECSAVLTSILREDKIYGNDVLSHWSTQK